ncbi:hypothetical protein E2320_000867, partial [Naja naja]
PCEEEAADYFFQPSPKNNSATLVANKASAAGSHQQENSRGEEADFRSFARVLAHFRPLNLHPETRVDSLLNGGSVLPCKIQVWPWSGDDPEVGICTTHTPLSLSGCTQLRLSLFAPRS